MSRHVEKLGDMELKSISFDNANVNIKVFDPHSFTFLSLIFEDVSLMFFKSCHMQNVISSLSIFETLEEAHEVISNMAYKEEIQKNYSKSDRIAYIEPLTDGEVLLLFKELRINR